MEKRRDYAGAEMTPLSFDRITLDIEFGQLSRQGIKRWFESLATPLIRQGIGFVGEVKQLVISGEVPRRSVLVFFCRKSFDETGRIELTIKALE